MKPWAIPDSIRRLALVFAVAAAYIVTGNLGFYLAIAPGNVSTVWPPSGIALAAVLLLGSRVWPGVWIGSFLLNLWFFAGLTDPLSSIELAISASIAAGSTLQALVGATLLRRFIEARSPFDRPQDAFRFVGIEALSCLIAPSVGVTSMCLGGWSEWHAFPYTWSTWWFGDVTGVIVLAPLILIWSKPIQIRWRTRSVTEVLVLVALLLTTCLVVFGMHPVVGVLYYPRAYALIPLLLWAAFRFGQRGVTLSLLAISGAAIWATIQGLGPFVGDTQNESLLSLQTFMAILAVTGLVLAAAVTDRQHAAEKLRQVVEFAPSAMVKVNEKGKIVLVNSQAEILFGYQRDEMFGRSIDMLVPERFRGQHPSLRKEFFAHPQARLMGAGRELYALRKDGSEIPVEIGLNPIETPEGTSVLSTIVDITERKRAEEKFRALAETATDAIFIIDQQSIIEFANSAASRIFGYPVAELVGSPLTFLMPEAFRELHRHGMQRFLETRQRHMPWESVELPGLHRDGREIPLEISFSAFPQNGRAIFTGIVRDITERKRAESQIRTALNEKELLLQEIHHRVKNNLQIISSLLNIQSRRIEDKKAHRTFEDSQNRIESIALVHEILCHSHDFSQIDFAKYVRELSHHLLVSYRKNVRDIQLEVNVDEVWLSVEKAVPLGLLINEIVSNSIIHGFPAGRKGTVRVELRSVENQQLALTLSDDGVGLPEAVDFHSPRSIGLQLVNKLAEQLRGTIEFHPNGGTQFKMLFLR